MLEQPQTRKREAKCKGSYSNPCPSNDKHMNRHTRCLHCFHMTGLKAWFSLPLAKLLPKQPRRKKKERALCSRVLLCGHTREMLTGMTTGGSGGSHFYSSNQTHPSYFVSPTETTTQRHDSEVPFEAWAGEIELFGSCHVGVYCVPFKRKASPFTLVICFRVHMHNKIHIQSDKSWFYRTRLLYKAVSQVLYCVSRRTNGLKINYLGFF